MDEIVERHGGGGDADQLQVEIFAERQQFLDVAFAHGDQRDVDGLVVVRRFEAFITPFDLVEREGDLLLGFELNHFVDARFGAGRQREFAMQTDRAGDGEDDGIAAEFVRFDQAFHRGAQARGALGRVVAAGDVDDVEINDAAFGSGTLHLDGFDCGTADVQAPDYIRCHCLPFRFKRFCSCDRLSEAFRAIFKRPFAAWGP